MSTQLSTCPSGPRFPMFERKEASGITQKLSCRHYALQVEKPRRYWLWVLLPGLLAGAAYAFMPQSGDAGQLALRAQIETLEARLEIMSREQQQLGLSLKHERATRQTLEKQLAEQAEELKRAQRDLAFYRGNATPAPATR